jgi:hypothetical protein
MALAHWIEFWRLYLLAALVIVIISLGGGAIGFLAGWTIFAIALLTVSAVFAPPVVRTRMAAAGAVLLIALLVAWRLDAYPQLGVLALAGNREAVLAMTLLAGVLGAVTATRWWLVVQSGIWCLAIAISGWWLFAQPESPTLIDQWRRYLPEKQETQLLAAPILRPFDPADALWLASATAVLFATAAFVGLLLREGVCNSSLSLHLSLVNAAALVIWVGGLLSPIGQRLAIGAVLLVLAAIAGAKARRFRELWVLPVALTLGVLTSEALVAAWDGLPSWWGSLRCDSLSIVCTPSQQVLPLVCGAGLLLVAAALGYGGSRWTSRFFAARASKRSVSRSSKSPA